MSAEQAKEKKAEIVVNGQLKKIDSLQVTFDEITELAFPRSDRAATTFTVLFSKAGDSRREGSMVEGDIVKIKKEGSSFNVTRSIRS